MHASVFIERGDQIEGRPLLVHDDDSFSLTVRIGAGEISLFAFGTDQLLAIGRAIVRECEMAGPRAYAVMLADVNEDNYCPDCGVELHGIHKHGCASPGKAPNDAMAMTEEQKAALGLLKPAVCPDCSAPVGNGFSMHFGNCPGTTRDIEAANQTVVECLDFDGKACAVCGQPATHTAYQDFFCKPHFDEIPF